MSRHNANTSGVGIVLIPTAEMCSNGQCRRRRRTGLKTCQVCADKTSRKYEKSKREKSAGLAPFLNDPTLLPKRPPGAR